MIEGAKVHASSRARRPRGAARWASPCTTLTFAR